MEVFADQDLHWGFVPIFGDVLGQEMGFEFTTEERVNKAGQHSGGDFRWFGFEFGHFIFQCDQTDSWNVAGLQAEELQNTFVLFFVGINENEKGLE